MLKRLFYGFALLAIGIGLGYATHQAISLGSADRQTQQGYGLSVVYVLGGLVLLAQALRPVKPQQFVVPPTYPIHDDLSSIGNSSVWGLVAYPLIFAFGLLLISISALPGGDYRQFISCLSTSMAAFALVILIVENNESKRKWARRVSKIIDEGKTSGTQEFRVDRGKLISIRHGKASEEAVILGKVDSEFLKTLKPGAKYVGEAYLDPDSNRVILLEVDGHHLWCYPNRRLKSLILGD